MYHLLKEMNHLKFLETSLWSLPEHICMAHSGEPCTATNQHSAVCLAMFVGSGQLEMCLRFILVESGMVEEYLLGGAEHLIMQKVAQV